jgi:hypothetical protein
LHSTRRETIVTVVLVSGFSVVRKWIYHQIRTVIRPPLTPNFVFQVHHWQWIINPEIVSYIISVKHRVMSKKPISAAGQHKLIVASICSIMGITFQPCSDSSRIQCNSSFVRRLSNYTASEGPVRERRRISIIAFCAAKIGIKREWREEHAGSLREVKETPRERTNINRSLGIFETCLAMDHRIPTYW